MFITAAHFPKYMRHLGWFPTLQAPIRFKGKKEAFWQPDQFRYGCQKGLLYGNEIKFGRQRANVVKMIMVTESLWAVKPLCVECRSDYSFLWTFSDGVCFLFPRKMRQSQWQLVRSVCGFSQLILSAGGTNLACIATKTNNQKFASKTHVIRILDELAIYAVNHLLTALNDLMLAKQSGQYRQKTIGHDNVIGNHLESLCHLQKLKQKTLRVTRTRRCGV